MACAAGRPPPSSCCPAGPTARTKWRPSTRARTTTLRSRSGWRNCSPGCAVGRRGLGDGDEPRFRLGDLVVDLAAKRVSRDPDSASGADIRLTPTEWHLLEVLLRHPGKLLGQQYLLKEVWGPGYADAAGNLRLYMAQLRRKLEPDPARPRWLLTEPGMGYRFQPDADTTSAGDPSPV